MSRWWFFIGRGLVAVFCVLTWAYGLIASVRFAFEQFIRPQLFPWVTQFVTWHHAWYWLAFVVSVSTLIPELRAIRAGGPRRTAGWLAAGFVICFGAIGVHLLSHPYLVTIDGGTRSWVIVPGALIPLLWLALVDHLAAGVPADASRRMVTGQRRVFAACLATGSTMWLLHIGAAAFRSDTGAGLAGRVATAVWALSLDVAAALAAAVVLSLAAAIAATRRRSFEWEFGLAVTLMAIAITEFARRLVLPSLGFGDGDAAASAVPFGLVMAVMWSGWRLRQRRVEREPDTALAMLTSLFDGRSRRSVLFASLVPVLALVVSRAVEQVDWALIANRLIALVEAALIFGFFLARFRDRQDEAWSNFRLVVAPVAALAALTMLPYAASATADATGNPQLQSELALERLPTSDPLGAAVARVWIEQQPPNTDYYRAMTTSTVTQSSHRLPVPKDTYAQVRLDTSKPLPNVFIFLIDSLRRDYLSPYNPSVSFTPNLEGFAADSYVFTNAFTQYGGTWMSIPAVWTGAPMTRSWGYVFKEMNALEPLIRGADFDFLINDYTVETELLAPRTFLNPGIQSVQTDLCDNVAAMQAHIDSRTNADRPLFTFVAPMNVHIMNTRTPAGGPRDPRYEGFYPSYASRLERLDGCFGSFLTYLRERGMYDNSIIMLASDHGETLGTDGNWGHQYFLFPEDVRIPLIIRVPPSMRARFTADLSRVALLSDVAPTLLTLLGQPVPDLPSPFGATLFVPPNREPRPRRRESFLLMSSYGATFALLRRNGKFLYISDLMSWREYAYSLFAQPLGERVPVTEVLRRIGQSDLRKRIDEVDAVYRR